MAAPAHPFLDRLREASVLEPAQWQELISRPEAREKDPAPLARLALQKGWLTRYQINAIAGGRGKELKVGPYVLLDRLGEGGMGQVFKARHARMGRIDAVKLIRKERLASPDTVRRFYQEVRMAAQLQHPHIALAYNADEADGVHYLAMEYIEGTDLSRLVKEEGPLPARKACEYIRQASLGLQHAHEKGLVHRDLKPANLLVSGHARPDGGTVKILDFGLARLAESGDGEHGLTREGAVLGTPDYLAPEQAVDSRFADTRADLYALGCSLFFLLTRRPPFTAPTLTGLLLKHQTEEAPRLSELGVKAPPGLQEVLDRLLAKKPEARYQSPAELVAALAPLCQGRPLPVAAPVAAPLPLPPPRPPRATDWGTIAAEAEKPPSGLDATDELPRPVRAKQPARATGNGALILAASVGGALLVLLIGLVAYFATRPGAPPARASKERGGAKRDSKEEAPPAEDDDNKKPPANQPKDGFKLRGGRAVPPPPVAGNPDLGVRIDECAGAAYAHDGTILVASRRLGLHMLDPTTGRHLRTIGLRGLGVNGLAVNADGTRLLTANADRAVRLWDLRSGAVIHKMNDHEDRVHFVAFSPDGKLGASGGGHQSGRGCAIRLWGLEKGTLLRKLEGHEKDVWTVAFSPDSKWLVSTAFDRTVRVWDVKTGKQKHLFDKEGQYTPSAVYTPAGGLLVTLGTCAYLWDAETGARKMRFFEHSGGAANFAITTPDGKTVLSVGQGDKLLRIWDAENARQLASMSGHTQEMRRVAVSPDGRRALTTDDSRVMQWDLVSLKQLPLKGP